MEHGKYQIWYWYVNITKCTELWNYQLTIKAVGPTSMTKSNCNIYSQLKVGVDLVNTQYINNDVQYYV